MATQLPQPFGKYILLNKIALGGMAEIFRAKTIGAEGFEKEVVIKRILPHFTEDEAFVTMFIDEAKVSSGLNHPNIVQIFDFDIEQDTYYISMEYIEGKDLKRLMDCGVKGGKPLSVEQVVYIIMETCKGLHYAHTKKRRGKPLNIIHRDVSPHNVMVSFDGEVKVMDFGIAKAAARSTKTRAGTVKGKCAYMSPEQARGKQLDPRSDMFAVGVMMWEMLTHRRLFAGDSDFETLSNVLKAEVPPPSTLNNTVPPAIDAILLKCLSKDRDDRQGDCRGLQRELEQWFYQNVNDNEVAELSPLMAELFNDDISALREMQAADAKTNFFEVSEMVRSGRSGSSSQVEARHSSSSNVQQQPAAPSNEARTVALDVADARAALDSDRTLAVDPSSTGHQVGPEKKKSRVGLWIGLLVLLAALGVGGWFGYQHFMAPKPTTPTSGDGPVAENTTGAATTGNSDPGATGASTQTGNGDTDGNGTASGTTGDGDTGNGSGDTGSDTDPGTTGQGAAAGTGGQTGEGTAGGDTGGEATGGETGNGEGTGADGGTTGDPNGVATTGGTTGAPPEPVESKLTLSALPSDATLEARGQKAVGTLTIEATIGDVIAVIVTHPEYKPVVRQVTLDVPEKTVDIPLIEKIQVAAPIGLATVTITVTPPTATLSVNGQEQPQTTPGQYSVQGFKVGEDVELSVAAPNHITETEKLRITAPELTKAFELRRRAATPSGPGKARFNAKPWARVTVAGQTCMTPCTLELRSGRHSATFAQSGTTKRRAVRIQPGRTVRVFVDMTK